MLTAVIYVILLRMIVFKQSFYQNYADLNAIGNVWAKSVSISKLDSALMTCILKWSCLMVLNTGVSIYIYLSKC